ncbi:serine/threonine-protein kinase [Streptomyces sp. SBT349]|uniref:serine/threonine-protein kinase n=1 Tax=Streptomyces sp. SBT349 TaxID=1580539 RepID=UPI000A95CA08|nr:serine/threonine-protein kinase [Streptomyces sp. SBT349]
MGQDNGDTAVPDEMPEREPRDEKARADSAPADTPADAAADKAAEGGVEEPSDAPVAAPSADVTEELTRPVRAARLLNGRYRLGSVVGRGGMGTVWHATDEVLGRAVAVKELRLPPGVDDSERKRMITRTLREAKAIATIRSRGVVTIYDVVDEGSRPWIVMELIEGRSLADVVRNDGPMSPARAAATGLAVLEVLRAAHAAGILHRDVKPSNVIIADEDGRVVLTDFGIAKVEGDPSITSTGMLVGAPSYISPERARGAPPGPPADLWSLGALLFCCVEGRPPYDEGGAIATLAAVMHDPVPAPRRAGPLTEVIAGLLRKDPAARLDEPEAGRMLAAALTEAEKPAAKPAGDEPKTLVVGLGPAGTPARPSKAPGTPGSATPAVPATLVPDAAPTPAQSVAAIGADAPTPPPTPVPPRTGAGGSTTTRGSRPGDERRRRALVVAGVVVALLALLGAALATALTGGGDDETETGGQGPTQEAPTPDGEEESEDPAGGEEPSGGPSDTADPPPEGSPEEDGPPGTSPETDPGAELPETPAGYSEIEDTDFNFRISLPQGWERTGTSGQNSGAVYSAPGGEGPKVQVDFTDSPTEDAVEAWEDLEPSTRTNSTDYQRISIEAVEWRDYPTVADWHFERTEGGTRVHVLDRGFRIDASHGYAIMITCAADAWNDRTCSTLRETAFETFQPLN